MKIVAVSNHNIETDNDMLVCDHINEHYGKRLTFFLNKDVTESSKYYFKLKDDDYILHRFQP